VGQIYKHLALATDVMLDGAPASPPAPIQRLLRMVMKKRMTTKTLSPGFRLTRKAAVLIPDETTPQAGLLLLQNATERVRSTTQRARHPVFGACTCEEWDAFHFRHCEMHMSFIIPEP